MERLLTLVGDRRNVAGLIGAASGLGLTFGGVIEAGWWAITAGLYAAGFLAAQLTGPRRSALPGPAHVPELPADLRRLAAKVGHQLPAPAQAHLANILTAAESIEPRLRQIDPANLSVISVRQIMADYIPTTLAAYAALPARVRSRAKLADGRTADVQITAQLALLEQQMDQLVVNLSRGDLLALETQGRFLADKFTSSEPFGH